MKKPPAAIPVTGGFFMESVSLKYVPHPKNSGREEDLSQRKRGINLPVGAEIRFLLHRLHIRPWKINKKRVSLLLFPTPR